jgi:hypothetical protein
MASVSAVRPSARSFVVGFSVVLAAARNLLPAVEAHGAAFDMSGTVSAGTDNNMERPRPKVAGAVGSSALNCVRRVADYSSASAGGVGTLGVRG